MNTSVGSVTKRLPQGKCVDARVVEDASGYKCKYCQSTRIKRQHGPHPGGHYAKITCHDCTRFLKWEGWPKESKPKRSTSNHSELMAKYSKGQCEICLRNKLVLPLPQTLEVHHIVEVKDGGTDDLENIQIVCTPCHRWIHHQRTYLGHYNPASQIAAEVLA